MSGAREYRVRWQREGLAKKAQVFQTERGAREKAERLEVLDETKGVEDEYSGAPFADMPDLIAPPVIEHRVVGAWGPVETEAPRLVSSIPGQLEIEDQEAAA